MSNPIGRPKGSKGKNNRTVRKNIFLTPEEWVRVEIEAESRDLKPNDFFRLLYRTAIDELIKSEEGEKN